MKAIVEFRIPASETAFEATFEGLPEFRFELQQVVESERGETTPPVWVGGAAREEIEAAFDGDETVAEFTLVSSEDERWLYQIEWGSQMNILTDILLMNGGTVLDAFGYDAEWWFRILYTDAETLERTLDSCRERDVTVEIARLVELAAEADAEEQTAESLAGLADVSTDVIHVTDSDEVANALEVDAGPFFAAGASRPTR